MEEKYQAIIELKEFSYKQIEDANKRLEEIRETCDHPEEYHEVVTYSTRPGQYWDNTTICGICGAVVKWPYEGMNINLTPDDEKEIKSWDDGGCSTGVGND